jgi:hypothetical protein
MARKGIGFNTSRKPNFQISAGVVLIFAGMFSMGVSRAFIGLHFGEAIKIFSFFGGIVLLGLGLYVEKRRRKLR